MNSYLSFLCRTSISFSICWFAAVDATAQIRVEKSAGDKITIHLAGLQVENDEASRLFWQTLQGNLNRSGWLAVVGAGQAEVGVTGSVRASGDHLSVQCTVTHTGDRRTLLRNSYRQPVADTRRLAHRVADDIVEAVTGRKGIASTRIVMVGVTGNAKELFVCDADGGNLMQLTHDRNIAIRPRWGPKADRLTYTAYLQRWPDVFLVDLGTGSRTVVANYSGLNSGGVLSPDGQDLAVVLSKDGNPELYVKNLRSGRLTRLTNTAQANEASPSWSPDGREIVYVSDQAGRPQLYIISRDGGAPRRVTSRGSENVAPDWGPNGLIVFASRVGRQYQIAILDPRSDQMRYLEHRDQADYEDPSWAPNGRHIVCSRKENRQSAIYILDTVSDPPLRLTPNRGDWYSPAWSPE